MLVLNWTLGQAAWLLTGDNLPLKIYFAADVAVVAVICAKAARKEGSRTYSDLADQLTSFSRSLTVWDRWIAASYIFAVWPLYVLEIDARTKWFLLWGILIAQFILAAGEAAQSMLGATKKRFTPGRPPGGSGLAFARVGGSG
jgi:hypothetical protein